MSQNAAPHWADIHADKIVREKGPKDQYTCASGITPSGIVHIGNFREIISVDLVVRALRDKGHNARFIYSWDDYDTFRKVPKGLPQQEMLAEHLRWPIVDIPDPWGREESYARANELELEALLPRVGVDPEYIYQAKRYRNSDYAEGIRRALERRGEIRDVLNQHRKEPLGEEWWPITIFSTFSNRDNTTVLSWDGAYGVTYRCDDTEQEETLDLRLTGAVKLLWRVDWPMRWREEGVDFEPAGKEHHSAGGSFDTAKEVSKRVYDYDAPVTFKYDFISIKGMGGKISSSLGNVVSLRDALEVYQPEIVRHLFAGTKPNSEFAVSFDLDVIKIYEDYDKSERIYYGVEDVGEKRRAKEARIYELSQIRPLEEVRNAEPPLQVPFRHLCNLLQIHAGDLDAALRAFPGVADQPPAEWERLRTRARCAWNWTQQFAPEDFRFTLKSGTEGRVGLDAPTLAALRALRAEVADRLDQYDEKTLNSRIYDIAREQELEPKDFFTSMYQVLVGKDHGPRLAGFIYTIGRDRILSILDAYEE
jgi:lysyl-tRNA synthetase, class I